MIVLHGLVRVVTVVLLLALALLGLLVAAVAVDPAGVADLLGLGQLRDTVGAWFDDLAADGSVAVASALGGLAAILVGGLLLAGLFAPRRERLVRLPATEHGTLSARRRPLSQIASHLAESVTGVARVRSTVTPRRGGGGRLRVRADRARNADPGATKQALVTRLENLTEPFGLTSSVQTRLGDKGRRVQ